MGDVRKPSGLNKFIEQFLVVTGSKTVQIILLLFIICGGFFTIYTEINRIFPIDIREIHGLTVQNEEKKPVIGPWTQKFLMKDDLEQVVQRINDLKLVQRQHLGDVISTWTLDETRYSIRIIYDMCISFTTHCVKTLSHREKPDITFSHLSADRKFLHHLCGISYVLPENTGKTQPDTIYGSSGFPDMEKGQ